jgi:co-chaperonin GroES (HSP10)
MSAIRVKTLVPLQNLLVVKADAAEVETATQGGIALPDVAQAVAVKRIGSIVSMGPDCVRGSVGMRVLFSAYSGATVIVDGDEFEMMPDSAILAEIS